MVRKIKKEYFPLFFRQDVFLFDDFQVRSRAVKEIVDTLKRALIGSVPCRIHYDTL